MGLFDAFQGDHSDVHHHGSLTHDALAGAVAFEATKAYEDHCARNGRPDDHARAKEIFAGFAAAAATQLAETKGRDVYDRWNQRQVEERAQERFQEEVLVRQYDNDDY